jgi:hypothetical protein
MQPLDPGDDEKSRSSRLETLFWIGFLLLPIVAFIFMCGGMGYFKMP